MYISISSLPPTKNSSQKNSLFVLSLTGKNKSSFKKQNNNKLIKMLKKEKWIKIFFSWLNKAGKINKYNSYKKSG